jgi:uncharacterized protein YbjT (DUF2867 family)
MMGGARRQTVVIAGASGFVGRALIERLIGHFNVIGLSRSIGREQSGVTWRSCDLFSLKEAEIALESCDIAIYLVHSMLPTARLTQGRFDDLDLIIADNFARAAAKNGIKKIIYLGGLISDGDLSLHLESRREVEEVLASHGIPCTTLRAGLVVGPHGSSFDMMRKLVDRLPMMICPKWTSTRTQPIALADVTTLIANVISDDALAPQAYDIGGPDVLTYIDMLRITADAMGKKRLFFPVVFFSPKLSRLWVRLVTGAPSQLIGPLVESLRHAMVCRDDYLAARYGLKAKPFKEALRLALNEGQQNRVQRINASASYLPTASVSRSSPLNTVCSVQRLPLPAGKDAAWVAERYATWLIEFLYPFIRVGRDGDGSLKLSLQLGLKRWSWILLVLTYARERSSPQRQLFYIQGGALLSAKAAAKGRFEFREVLHRQYVVAAIFDFVPALPWWIYMRTQAILHLFVMWAFKKELERGANT